MQETAVAANSTSIPEPKPKGIHFVLLGLVFAAVFYAYFIQPTEGQGTTKNPKSAMRWMVGHWEELSNYSHGPLIPLISAGLVFRRSKRFLKLWDGNQKFRQLCCAVGAIVAIGILWDSLPRPIVGIFQGLLDRVGWGKYDFKAITLFIPLFAALGFYLTEQEAMPSQWGLTLIIVAVLLYFVGVKSAQTHTVVGSFIILLYGLAVYLWGRAASKPLVFPIAFLFLMVPVNLLDRVTVPLATLATFCAGHLCNAIGVEVLWKGNTIWS